MSVPVSNHGSSLFFKHKADLEAVKESSPQKLAQSELQAARKLKAELEAQLDELSSGSSEVP